MRYLIYFCILTLLIACTNSTTKTYHDPSLSAAERAAILLSQMTLEEKVGQMCQYVGTASLENPQGTVNPDERVKYEMGLGQRAELIRKGHIGSFLKVPSYKEANYLQELAQESRLKIPLLIATDAIHGHGMYVPPATIFPTPIGMAASFNPEIAETIARYTAVEMRASGYQWTFSPNVEVVRDARWGRFGESFGEDPLLVGTMGAAMVRGYQGTADADSLFVLACAKHFVGGGIAYNGLNGAPADISERTLHEIFFPPFIRCIDEGVYSIMPAHNQVNGVPCHAHKEFLTGLIRESWNFEGFFISDWMDIERLYEVNRVVNNHKEAAEVAVNVGLDMHMHGPEFHEHVIALVNEGRISEERIDEAVEKILTAKFRLGLFENPFIDTSRVAEVLLQPTHRAYALESARKSMVLLKNDGILPLKKQGRILVTGPLADHQGILGDWSRPLPDSLVTTVLEGMRSVEGAALRIDYLPTGEIELLGDEVMARAGVAAAGVDVVVAVVGENAIRFSEFKTSGENLDRPTLELAGRQLEFLQALHRSGTPLVVVYVNGGPVASPWTQENAAAILEAWEPGMAGGQAVAEVLFGDINPGGRMPATVPRSAGHIQQFYNYNPSAYHRGKYKFEDSTPLYPFGFGLSYTSFSYGKLECQDTASLSDDLFLRFQVTNTGDRAGDEVVLVFLNDVISSVATPVKELVAFRRVHLEAGESRILEFTINNKDFAFLDSSLRQVKEPGEFQLIIGLDRMKHTLFLQ